MGKLFTSFFIVLIFLFSTNVLAQKTVITAVIENPQNKSSSDTIYYDFNQKLKWQDFQGKPEMQPYIGAITASGFAFHSSMVYSNNILKIRIGIYSFFTKHDSWKKKNINSDYHLEHEQHHFDITRLGAQNFMDEIKKAEFTAKNYRQLMNSIFARVFDENTRLQQEYDLDTKNSIDVAKQLEWNKKITDKINSLKSLE
ncbi:MAG: hypothetical protein ABIR31_09025 [Ginsengibacter sp.]